MVTVPIHGGRIVADKGYTLDSWRKLRDDLRIGKFRVKSGHRRAKAVLHTQTYRQRDMEIDGDRHTNSPFEQMLMNALETAALPYLFQVLDRFRKSTEALAEGALISSCNIRACHTGPCRH